MDEASATPGVQDLGGAAQNQRQDPSITRQPAGSRGGDPLAVGQNARAGAQPSGEWVEADRDCQLRWFTAVVTPARHQPDGFGGVPRELKSSEPFRIALQQGSPATLGTAPPHSRHTLWPI